MKIALITPGNKPLPPSPCSSIEIYLSHLARELAGRHQVNLYGKGSPKQNKGLRIKTINFGHYLPQVIQDMKQHKPTVIQIDNRPAFVKLVRNKKNAPVVLNVHSTIFLSKKHISPQALKDSLYSANAVVVNSNYLGLYLIRRYKNLYNKIFVIHPGVDLDRFPSRNSPLGQNIRKFIRGKMGISNKTVLLYAGRLIPRKGIVLLLKAFAQLIIKHPGLRLWIVGGKPQPGKNPFHKKIVTLAKGLPVRFFPLLPHEKMHRFYLAADLLICPSQLPEAFGMVNIEAASCALPSMGSDAWGIRESIAHGTGGWLVRPYHSKAAWVKTIDKALADPQLLVNTGRKARHWVCNSFSWKRTANEFEALYHLIQKR
ncbi:MAG: glycosyltransferase family 4 protein [Clostridia bacterium]|nr:glycosyltransferase family 4 protein [Clostridia bacterium]